MNLIQFKKSSTSMQLWSQSSRLQIHWHRWFKGTLEWRRKASFYSLLTVHSVVMVLFCFPVASRARYRADRCAIARRLFLASLSLQQNLYCVLHVNATRQWDLLSRIRRLSHSSLLCSKCDL